MSGRDIWFALPALMLLAPVTAAGPAWAADDQERLIVIEDHQFDPSVVEVPAGVRIKLEIENRDATAEEFESLDLRREKIVPGKSSASLWVGPLPAGEYGFHGEFHPETAKGKLIAK